MEKVRKVTLDTNIFAVREIPFVEFLLTWQAKGMVQLAVSVTVLAEINLIADERLKRVLIDYAQQMKLIETTKTPINLANQVQKQIFPRIDQEHPKYAKRAKDIQVLTWHIFHQGDILVTRDRHFLQHAPRVQQTWNTLVLTPEECRSYLAK